VVVAAVSTVGIGLTNDDEATRRRREHVNGGVVEAREIL
jgi:hypothetical protein